MQRANLTRWVVSFLIGIYVAVIAVVVAMCITVISKFKFMALYMCILFEGCQIIVYVHAFFFCGLDICAVFEDCDEIVCLLLPGVVWIAINVVLVLIGSYIVTYHAVNTNNFSEPV